MLSPLVTVAALLICVLLLGFAIYVWVRQRRFTRERFAFVAFSSCISLTVCIASTIAGKASPWEQLLSIAHYIRTGETLPTSLSVEISALLMLCLFGIYMLTYLMFKNWNGKVSKETFRARALNNERLMQEFLAEANRLLRRRPPIEPYEHKTATPHMPNLGRLVDPTPWKDLAKQLIRMHRNMLEFGEWRTEHRFWVARDRDRGCWIGFRCTADMPSNSELERFVEYGRGMTPTITEYVLLLKTGTTITETASAGACIQIISEDTLLDGLIDFSEYRAKIKRRVLSDNLPDSDLTLDNVYVEPRYRKHITPHSNAPRWARLTFQADTVAASIQEWLQGSDGTQIAILGEYGQGKSTAALMLTWQMLSVGSSRTPILVELRGKSPATMTRGELLSMWGHAYGIEGRRLEALHEAGRLLLIFDGFDEMTFVGNPQDRLRHFQTLWSFNHKKARMILTGRPNLFLDDNELKADLGIKQGSGGKLVCEAWHLEKFGMDDISQALRSIDESTRAEILTAVKDNERLYDIASRPSLLHVISVIWGDDLSSRAAELTSAEIVHRFLAASLQRQTEKARDLVREEELSRDEVSALSPRNYMVINASERRFFMVGIAVHMMKRGETNQIHLTDLNEVIERLAKICPDSVSTGVNATDGHSSLPIRHRVERSRDFLSRLQDDVRVCGLLVADTADGAFRFGHKSFLEYLVADYASRAYAGSNDDDIEAIASLGIGSVDNLLRTSVARNYFGELILWRNKDIQISKLTTTEIAKALFLHIVNPSFRMRFTWRLWATPLRLTHKQNGPKAKRSKYFALLLISRMAYSDFLWIHLRRPAVIEILGARVDVTEGEWGDLATRVSAATNPSKNTLLDASITLAALLTLIVFLAVEMAHDESFLVIPIAASSLFLTLLLASSWRRKTVFVRTWIEICKAQGCSVEDLYAAIFGHKDASSEFSSDPLELYTKL